jgi:hypothetical protein
MVDRDDFSEPVKRRLADRVGHLCSNPDCRALTTGPHSDADKALNVGVAAHITAAAPGGPRYDPMLTPAQRGSIENAIWLCQNCAKLIDNDTPRFIEILLRQWKAGAEERARFRTGRTASEEGVPVAQMLGTGSRKAALLAVQSVINEAGLDVREFWGAGTFVCCPACGADVAALRGFDSIDDEHDRRYVGAECTKCGWCEGSET